MFEDVGIAATADAATSDTCPALVHQYQATATGTMFGVDAAVAAAVAAFHAHALTHADPCHPVDYGSSNLAAFAVYCGHHAVLSARFTQDTGHLLSRWYSTPSLFTRLSIALDWCWCWRCVSLACGKCLVWLQSAIPNLHPL